MLTSEVIQRYNRTAIDAKCYCRKTKRDLTKSRLGETKKAARFNENQRSYLDEKFLSDNQLGLKLIHHTLHATFEMQELTVENEDLALMNFTTADQVILLQKGCQNQASCCWWRGWRISPERPPNVFLSKGNYNSRMPDWTSDHV